MDDFTETIDEYNVYWIGETSFRYIPNEKEVDNMVRLVAYDVCDSKRLRLVAKACEDYGIRIEKSVFECDLKEEDFRELWNLLMSYIDDSTDSLIAYKVCKSCIKDIESAGVLSRPSKKLAYIF